MPDLLYTDGVTKVWYASRAEWGSSPQTEDFIAQRWTTTPEQKTEIIVHHTAAVDTSDATPNQWMMTGAFAYMRRLEYVRPDLRPLPYSVNLAVLEDPHQVVILEGRGIDVGGAHTAGHNTVGIGIGVLGNFDKATDPAAIRSILKAITWLARTLRHQQGYVNLGSSRNPAGWEVWGHRDTTSKSCPGNLLYPELSKITYVTESEVPMSTPLKDYEKAAIARMEKEGIFSPFTTDEPGEVDDPVTIRKLAVFLSRTLDAVDGGLSSQQVTSLIAGAIEVHASDPDAHHE